MKASASAAVGAAAEAAVGALCARAGVATASDRASDSVEIMAFMGASAGYPDCALWRDEGSLARGGGEVKPVGRARAPPRARARSRSTYTPPGERGRPSRT